MSVNKIDKKNYTIEDLEELLDKIPYEIFIKDTNGIYQYVNLATEKKLGIKKEEIIGKNDYDIRPKTLAHICDESDKSVLENGDKEFVEDKIINDNIETRYEIFKALLNNDKDKVKIGGIAKFVSEDKSLQISINENSNKIMNNPKILNSSSVYYGILKDLKSAVKCNEVGLYLYDKNNIDWAIVPSTLMYLANRSFYMLDSNISDEDELINVKFKRIKDSSECEYSHLKILMDWFKEYEDSNNEFTFESIKNKIKNSQKATKKFNNSYLDFINEIRLNGRAHNYYINIKDKEVLNNDAYNEYLKWSAYKKYLLSLIQSKSIDNIKESIIYSPALGISHYDLEIDPTSLNGNSLNYNDFNHTFYNSYMANVFLFNEIHNLTNNNHNSDSNFNNNMDFGNNSFNDFSSGGGFSGGGGGDSGAF